MPINFKKPLQKGYEIDNPFEPSGSVVQSHKESGVDVELCRKNKLVFWGVISLLFFVLFSRSFYLQMVQGSYYQDVAENNRIREIVIKAPRGKIIDQHGEVLAQNVPSFEALFIPANLPQEVQELESISSQLSQIIDLEQSELSRLLKEPKEGDRSAYLLKENIPQDAALEIVERASELAGIYIGKTARRDYVDGRIFAHIIGYDGKITKTELEKNPNYLMTDYIGKDGLEFTYEKHLHGIHGAHRYEVDSNNNIKEDLGTVNPVPGNSLVLHLDAQLQKKIMQELEQILSENKDAKGAAAVAIDPRTGGVRAMVSLPSFDNNMFAKGIKPQEYEGLINDQAKPLLNRTIKGEYPPGSTFKPFVAAAALEEGLIHEHTSINCPGVIAVGSWTFPDWSTHGHTDVRKAIAESCNVFFYSIAGGWGSIEGLGITRLEQYGKIFGYGSLTGIDLPGELDGNLPNENWKFKQFEEKWYVGDSYHLGIGQGYMTVTPLQQAVMVATIANGGTLLRPQVVSQIIDAQNGQSEQLEPIILEQNLVSRENIKIVQEGMRQTVTDGSGVSLSSLAVETAGKTGTAQFGIEEKTHSWYVSYGPYSSPELAMVVLVDGGGEGHDWAVPATKEIYKWYFDCDRGNGCQEEGEVNEISNSPNSPNIPNP